jgi:hypothetical protein
MDGLGFTDGYTKTKDQTTIEKLVAYVFIIIYYLLSCHQFISCQTWPET